MGNKSAISHVPVGILYPDSMLTHDIYVDISLWSMWASRENELRGFLGLEFLVASSKWVSAIHSLERLRESTECYTQAFHSNPISFSTRLSMLRTHSLGLLRTPLSISKPALGWIQTPSKKKNSCFLCATPLCAIGVRGTDLESSCWQGEWASVNEARCSSWSCLGVLWNCFILFVVWHFSKYYML